MVSLLSYSFDHLIFIGVAFFSGTIRLWQTTPGKTYGLWQGTSMNEQ